LDKAYQDHGLLFCYDDGRLLPPEYVTRYFERLAYEAAGLPRYAYKTSRMDRFGNVGRVVHMSVGTLSARQDQAVGLLRPRCGVLQPTAPLGSLIHHLRSP
jgi:hypothetical protein